MAKHLPSVLQGTNGQSSISMERALKQIRDLLLYVDDASEEDRVNASLDDIDMMIRAIDRTGD